LLYREGANVYTDFNTPDLSHTGVGHSNYTGSDFALSNPSPGGIYVTIREKARVPPENENYTDLEFSFLDSTGLRIKGPWVLWYERLPDWPVGFHSWRDIRPSVAVAPNGNIGFAWIRVTTNALDINKVRYNVYFTLMDPDGHLIYPDGGDTPYQVLNVTGNTIDWYDINGDVLAHQSLRLVATPDNKFYLTWVERKTISGRSVGDVSHAVYDAFDGNEWTGPEILTGGNFLDKLDYWEPMAAPYQPPGGGAPKILLAYVFRDTTDDLDPDYQIKYRINRTDGLIVGSEQTLYNVDGEDLDITKLSNDNLAIAWNDPQTYQIHYTIRGSDVTSDLSGLMTLDNPDNRKGGSVSVTYDSAGRAILTWMDVKWFGRLYYALVDHNGVITPPVTIKYTHFNLETALQTRVALGNAYYAAWHRISLPLVMR
jgi:hypothetical protein